MAFSFIIWLLVAQSPEASEFCWIASRFVSDQPEIEFICEGEGGRFVGEIYRYEDREVIQELVLRSAGKIKDETKISEDLLKKIQSELEAILAEENSGVKIRRRGGKLFLSGNVTKNTLEKLKRLYPELQLPGEKKSKARFESDTSVFLELAFVELKKEAVEKLGLRFGSPIEFGTSIYLKKILNPADLVQVTGGNPVGSLLDLLLREGQGRIHFKQSVVGQNRKKAKFEVGGEYSLRLSSENVAQIGSIRYGVDLEFTPKILDKSQIHLLLDIQIREPDLAAGIDGLPLIQTKKLQSQLVTKLEQTMAIGGFVRAQQLRSTQRLPLLGELPFFGRLFESKDFLTNKSEAYLFITPRKLTDTWMPSPENF